MEYVKKYIIPLFTIVAVFALLFILRTVPVSRIWKGFTVMYVPADTDGRLVLKTLQDNGCKDVISYYNQKVPFINEFLPVKADSSDAYLSGRNGYFFDKDRKVMLYYIPDEYSRGAQKTASTLINQYNIDTGLDCKSSFPLLTPIICIIAAIIFFIFCEQKLVFLLFAIFPLTFAFSMPFYTNAAAVCLFLYAGHICQKIWMRKGALSFVRKNMIVLIFAGFALITAFFASFVSGFMFMLSGAGSFCALLLLHNYQVEQDLKRRFQPTLIRPARFMNMINVRVIKRSLVCAASCFVLFVLYITSVNVFSISKSQDLSFPMPTRYNVNNGIPSLNDYIIWSWNTITMPYRSLNDVKHEVPQEGESVVIQRFTNTENGIKASEEVIWCFDSDFRKEVVNSIDMLDYPAIEKMMKVQESGFSVDFSYAAGEKFSKSNCILLLVLIILPCGMTIIYLTGRKKHGYAI